jgi:hypothetical protein
MSTISSSTTTTTAFGVTADTTGALVIQTGATPTTAMTIDTSQNVGIGVTPSAWYPSYRALSLGYSSNGMFSGGATQLGLTQNAYLDSGLNYVYTTSNPASQYIQQSGVHTWRSAASGTAGNAITFTQLLAVEKDKSLALQGATSATGTGIAFPATQSASSDANTLDDYEEGTWTPTLTDGTNNVSTYSQRTGNYVKVGNIVTIVIEITVSNKGSVSSSLRITGLPFYTSKNGFQGAGLAQTSWSSLSGTLTGGMYGGDIYLYNQASGSQTNLNGGTNLTNTSQMGLSITYTL